MSDTIFYSLKLKRNKKPEQVFEKIKKAVKPKGPTAKWNVFTKGQSLCIDFGDEASETFCLVFNNKEAGGSCKVAFPMGGELFDNKNKSEWKTLIAILHSLKSLCSEISVDDDYDIADEYFKSLNYPFGMRELNAEETARLDRIYNDGYKNYETFLMKIFSEDTQRKFTENLNDTIGSCTMLHDPSPIISTVWETYIYETSTLKNKCLREIYYLNNWRKLGIIGDDYIFYGDPPAEIYTFCLGVGRLFSSYDSIDNTWGRGANVTMYFNDKFLPLFNQADDYEKCKLAYQFMLSVHDYCKFKFVGKEVINKMIAEFNEKHPSVHMP